MTNLNELFDALKERTVELDDDLPTFGGSEPDCTLEVWSWNSTHLIVGTCADDIEVLSREEWGDPDNNQPQE